MRTSLIYNSGIQYILRGVGLLVVVKAARTDKRKNKITVSAGLRVEGKTVVLPDEPNAEVAGICNPEYLYLYLLST